VHTNFIPRTNIQCVQLLYHTSISSARKFLYHATISSACKFYTTHQYLVCATFYATPIFNARNFYIVHQYSVRVTPIVHCTVPIFSTHIAHHCDHSEKFPTRLSKTNLVSRKSKWPLHNNHSKCNFDFILLRNLGNSLIFYHYIQFRHKSTLR